MTQFEKITQSLETLAAFLEDMPVIDGPWDKAFHERFCADCLYLGCDACPHEEFRNNPRWWLSLGAEADAKPGTAEIGIEPADEMESGRTATRFRFTGKAGALGATAAIMGELSKQLWMDGKKFRVTIDCDTEKNGLEIVRQDFI